MLKKTCLMEFMLKITSYKKITLVIVVCLFFAQEALTQTVVKGKIVSKDDNLAIPGVSVLLKGTKKGIVSDFDGYYSLVVSGENPVLEFSYLGYKTQRIAVNNQEVIDVALVVDQEQLGEVVLVAFGEQKKASIVGSVSSISAKELEKVSGSNLTTALAGRVAGVISYQRSGEPGQDNAEFFIRGVTTFGYKSDPLILIDGIELTTTDLARLQKDDIESFSILKDATATALYGSRGANGIILVKTKEGVKGAAKISLRLENSISAPTKQIEFADPVTYMRMHNEAVITRDPLGFQPYSRDKIENTVAGADPLLYPTNDWHDLLFQDFALNQRVNLNVNGGGEVARYFVAGSYDDNNGILRTNGANDFNNNISLKSYSLRTNVNINISPTTELIVKLNGSFDDYTGPLDGGADMYKKVVKSNPVAFPAYYPKTEETRYIQHIQFGNTEELLLNPYAEMVKGFKNYSRSKIVAQFQVKQDLSSIAEGLNASVMINTTRDAFFDIKRAYEPFFYESNGNSLISLNEGTESLDFQEGEQKISSSFYLETILNYSKTFNDKHNFSGTGIFRMSEKIISLTEATLQESLPQRNLGISGRMHYGFDNRYFAEFAFGYNGSERFHESNRFGFFPSFGVSWSVSNEKFWEPLGETINNLRIRASYGVTGNDAIGASKDRFFYLSQINLNDQGKGASFGSENGYFRPGVKIERYANADIGWEKSYKKNIALDIGVLNRINIQAEYFSEKRTDILMDREVIPTTMGLQSGIKANVGEASIKGMDMSIDYNQFWGENWSLIARGNFTYSTNKFEIYEEPDYKDSWRSRIGRPIKQRYGYIAERLFVSDVEAENSALQNFGTYGGGDIKYTDVNNDGQITTADMVPIGNPTVPEITYGFGFTLGYKNFDVAAFFQGSANSSFWIDPLKTAPFAGGNQVLKAYADSYWSEGNRDLYALWPRLDANISEDNSDENLFANNIQSSTWFMRDGSFLRLKQVDFGYNLPKRVKENLNLSGCRFYLTGTNLLTFSKFKLWDVEMGGNGLGYPVQRTFSLGLNLSF